METLKFLVASKLADESTPGEVVREAAEWLQIQFQNAAIEYQFVPVGSGIACYTIFQVKPRDPKLPLLLELRIAEIKSVPYVSAEVRQVAAENHVVCFRYFGEMGIGEGRDTLLHFIADFVLSTGHKPA
ncbi:MAG: hypothetical protein H7A49_03635 [Akkermansiaceae bacterium]|nr:hypothetical protein [Akkermansiaceae bacterium]MCP5542980.1 hypothetical protein [Akkermansiaceae bacterium]MCP5547728.1 hypothetical protein [Akkermansiaceae bacterium]